MLWNGGRRSRPAPPLRIAMIGTRGVPAAYGGFETAIEEVGKRLVARGHEVVVYCRRGPVDSPAEHLGMRLVHLPALRMKIAETLSHSALSVLHAITRRRPADAAFVFNAANSPFVPFLHARGIPVALHMDGLEWKRQKWSGAGKRYYRLAEGWGVQHADAMIADAQGIADYYTREFQAPTELITYGAPIIERAAEHRLAELGLHRHGFHLVVARFEPENHVDLVVEGYSASDARLPLVVVGSAPYAEEYSARIGAIAASDPRIQLLGGIWDQELLDQLYANARSYVHGHSVGGTNPSLLRAIGAGTAVVAFDVSFNREVVREHGRYFDDAAGVRREIEAVEADAAGSDADGAALRERAREHYDWDVVASAYEDLARKIASGVSIRSLRLSGRRTGVPEPVTASASVPSLSIVPDVPLIALEALETAEAATASIPIVESVEVIEPAGDTRVVGLPG